ncbi:HutD/Ves family protein [Marilutibacter maris]|uniref:HutD family protein n=1 Tax=Marilutibacter maris TaxID=1605891 RepID=A0A2U9T1U6_9GAMM|nr:HutD family protein [Lysobacter maris]AWV06586.1 hypothetical protein C9I47_0865 [Lysobacter maris]
MDSASVIGNIARVIPSFAYDRIRWRNGLGWTREVAQGRLESASPVAEALPSDAWDWRLSIAEIDAEAPFSRFDGIEREQMLLSGEGLRLHGDGIEQELRPPHQRWRFRGEDALVGSPLDGRVEVANLMWRRERVDTTSWHRPLVGPMVIFIEPGSTWLVHLIAGQGMFADASGLGRIEAGDTAVLPAGATRLRHVLEGGGEAWLMRLQPR